MADFHRRIRRPCVKLQRLATASDDRQTRLPMRAACQPDRNCATGIELAGQWPVKADTGRLMMFQRVEQTAAQYFLGSRRESRLQTCFQQDFTERVFRFCERVACYAWVQFALQK